MSSMSNRKGLVKALAEYARAIKDRGWRAGEPIIVKHAPKFPDFDKFAPAIRLMFRADELLRKRKTR